MAHYSEMSFLFDSISAGTNIGQVSKILNNTSQGNEINVIKGGDNWVVYKDKDKKTGTENIKKYLSKSIYNEQSEQVAQAIFSRNAPAVKSKNPYLKLLDDFNGKNGLGLTLKAADFAYLRDLGVYPINRMAILRRFPEGCLVSEHLDEMQMEPISTIIGWVKPDANFGKIGFNETWGTTNKRFDVLLNELVQRNFGINVSSMVPIPDFAQGVLFEFYASAGLVSNNSPESIDEDVESYDGKKLTIGGGDWGLMNIPVGNPNVLQEAPFRDPLGQNIKSNFSFDLITTYEQKLLGDVDPGSAMLDILDNLYTMGTSNMVFYWNNTSKKISKALNNTLNGTQVNNPNSWWVFITTLLGSFWDALVELFNKVKTEFNSTVEKAKTATGANGASQAEQTQAKKDLEDKAKNEFNVFLQTVLTSTLAIHRFELRGSMELMMGGKYSSSPWFLTLGNPYSPWIATNHIIVKTCSVETSTEMGFNDQPQSLTATFTCEFSRSLGKQELMRMFNNTYRRTYNTPDF